MRINILNFIVIGALVCTFSVSGWAQDTVSVESLSFDRIWTHSKDNLAGGIDAIWLGGSQQPWFLGSVGIPATSVAINIVGHPYGNFNNGCALCLIATGGGQESGAGRAAISGGDWHGGINANAGMGDVVGFYEFVGDDSARLVLPVSHYTATGVVLVFPLTRQQEKQLRLGMYIWSNSINTSITDTGSPRNLLSTPRFYGGYVTGWSGRTIDVNGWSVYGQKPTLGAIPNIDNLDTIYSKRFSPTVWLGSAAKVFARNVYQTYSEPSPGEEGSLARSFEGEEMDFRYTTTQPHSVNYSGLVISPQANGGIIDGSAFTDDSVGLVIAGGLPTQILLDGNCNSHAVSGWSIYVGKSCSSVVRSSPVGKTFTLSENVVVSDSFSIRQILRLRQDKKNANPNLYLGPIVTPGRNPSINGMESWYGQINGYVNGAVKYDLSNSSIALCGSGVNCSITVNGDGKITVTGKTIFSQPVQVDGGIRSRVITYKMLPQRDQVGTNLYCIDCYSELNNKRNRGIPVYWNGIQWTDSLGITVKH